MKVVSFELLPDVVSKTVTWANGTSYTFHVRQTRFVVEIGTERRTVIGEASSTPEGAFEGPLGSATLPRFDSRSRPVVCKFRTGAKLWPNQLLFWPPAGNRSVWNVNCPPITNSNRFSVVGWNDEAIDDRYFSRHIGARAR